MGWLSNKVVAWATESHKKEIGEFIAKLRAMDAAEIGLVVAVATHLRHGLVAEGHDVMDPINYTAKNVQFGSFLSRTTILAQKEKKPLDAAGLMVWLHTARGGVSLEVRALARQMWAELERGFPHVLEAAEGLERLSGARLKLRGANEFPIGFTPTPL